MVAVSSSLASKAPPTCNRKVLWSKFLSWEKTSMNYVIKSSFVQLKQVTQHGVTYIGHSLSWPCRSSSKLVTESNWFSDEGWYNYSLLLPPCSTEREGRDEEKGETKGRDIRQREGRTVVREKWCEEIVVRERWCEGEGLPCGMDKLTRDPLSMLSWLRVFQISRAGFIVDSEDCE